MKYGTAQKEPELDDTGGRSHYMFIAYGHCCLLTPVSILKQEKCRISEETYLVSVSGYSQVCDKYEVLYSRGKFS